MTNGAMATFSSPVICSFGLSGSLSLTSSTPANEDSGTSAATTNSANRFIGHLLAASAAVAPAAGARPSVWLAVA